jgi:hypothetical protein
VSQQQSAANAANHDQLTRQALAYVYFELLPQFENASMIEPCGRGDKKRDCQMRTLTAYGIGVVIVLAVLNGIAWQAGMAPLHDLNVLSAGFALGVLGTYIAAWLYGYRRVA